MCVLTAGLVDSAVAAADTVALARFTASGQLDTSFHHDGKLLVPSGGVVFDSTTDLAIDSAGRIYIGGHLRDGGGNKLFVMRRLPDGAADPSFSFDGIASVQLPNENDFATGLVLDTDGTIVVGASNSVTPSWGLARFTAGGTLWASRFGALSAGQFNALVSCGVRSGRSAGARTRAPWQRASAPT